MRPIRKVYEKIGNSYELQHGRYFMSFSFTTRRTFTCAFCVQKKWSDAYCANCTVKAA